MVRYSDTNNELWAIQLSMPDPEGCEGKLSIQLNGKGVTATIMFDKPLYKHNISLLSDETQEIEREMRLRRARERRLQSYKDYIDRYTKLVHELEEQLNDMEL